MKERKNERKKEREKGRKKETDRQTDRQTDKQTNRLLLFPLCSPAMSLEFTILGEIFAYVAVFESKH